MEKVLMKIARINNKDINNINDSFCLKIDKDNDNNTYNSIITSENFDSFINDKKSLMEITEAEEENY